MPSRTPHSDAARWGPRDNIQVKLSAMFGLATPPRSFRLWLAPSGGQAEAKPERPPAMTARNNRWRSRLSARNTARRVRSFEQDMFF